jgi:hypothetical protein
MQNNPDQQSRIKRAFDQKFFVIDLSETKAQYVFKISGSTAKLYTLTISKFAGSVNCDCPDYKTRNRLSGVWCKHLCFILLRVLHQPQSSIKKKIRREVVENIKIDRALTNAKYTSEYKRATGKHSASGKPVEPPLSEEKKQEDCLICYENFISDDKYIQCDTCRNIVHGTCMTKWLKFNKRSCVFCRADMGKITMVIPTESSQYFQFL